MAQIPQARDRPAAAPALKDLPVLHPPHEVTPNQLVLPAVTVGLALSHRFLAAFQNQEREFFLSAAVIDGFT
jgi:hypothetical protein